MSTSVAASLAVVDSVQTDQRSAAKRGRHPTGEPVDEYEGRCGFTPGFADGAIDFFVIAVLVAPGQPRDGALEDVVRETTGDSAGMVPHAHKAN